MLKNLKKVGTLALVAVATFGVSVSGAFAQTYESAPIDEEGAVSIVSDLGATIFGALGNIVPTIFLGIGGLIAVFFGVRMLVKWLRRAK